MNYEKFKAEVQEVFPGSWDFFDESSSFKHVGYRGTGYGRVERYAACRGSLRIYWQEAATSKEFPVAAELSATANGATGPIVEKHFRLVADIKPFLLEMETLLSLAIRGE